MSKINDTDILLKRARLLLDIYEQVRGPNNIYVTRSREMIDEAALKGKARAMAKFIGTEIMGRAKEVMEPNEYSSFVVKCAEGGIVVDSILKKVKKRKKINSEEEFSLVLAEAERLVSQGTGALSVEDTETVNALNAFLAAYEKSHKRKMGSD